jgi:hypothetical protein
LEAHYLTPVFFSPSLELQLAFPFRKLLSFYESNSDISVYI